MDHAHCKFEHQDTRPKTVCVHVRGSSRSALPTHRRSLSINPNAGDMSNDDIATRLFEPDTHTAKHSKDKGHRNVLPSGTVLKHYRIEHVIGRGGFGITYLAHNTDTNEAVAIKEFLPSNLAVRVDDLCVQPLSDEYVDTYQQGLSRFVDEADTLVRFSHPNIVSLYEVFLANNTAYMVMEYLDGETLSQAYKTGRICQENHLLVILKAMINALEAVHAKGLIHRDIKPSNIFITTNGRPVLIDFGSARHTYGAQTLTLTAMVSPGYAPFEQYHMTTGKDRQGPWTDIYALACTLYRGIAGRCYADAVIIAHETLAGEPGEDFPASLAGAGRFSDNFLEGIDVAMRFCPKDRPQSVKQWCRRFNRIATASDSIDAYSPIAIVTSTNRPEKIYNNQSANATPLTKRLFISSKLKTRYSRGVSGRVVFVGLFAMLLHMLLN